MRVESDTIQYVMTWLRKEAGLHPAAFMSNCCKALSKGIEEAFRHFLNPPKHYLCVVHVMKAACHKGAKIVSEHCENLAKHDLTKLTHNRLPTPPWPLRCTRILSTSSTPQSHLTPTRLPEANGQKGSSATSHTSVTYGTSLSPNGQWRSKGSCYRAFIPITLLSRGTGT